MRAGPDGMKRFFLLFIGIQLLLFGVELLKPVQEHVVLPFTAQLARLCSALISISDKSALAVGKVLIDRATGFAVSIEPGCNGVEACIVLFAAIVAFPARWRDRLVGLAAGFAAVQALNVVRIISLFYLGQWNREWFEFAHHYLWQGLIMLDVLVVFLVWARYFPQRLATAHAA
jgi:exosortase H (IPTLxxWG-CTERM-specific)